MRAPTAALSALLLAGPALAGSYRPPPSLELLDIRDQITLTSLGALNASFVSARASWKLSEHNAHS